MEFSYRKGCEMYCGLVLRIVYEESLVFAIGRACLMEVGYKSRWWARCNHVCDKFGLWEMVNLLWLGKINKEGMTMLGMIYDINCGRRLLWRESRSMAGDSGGMVSA